MSDMMMQFLDQAIHAVRMEMSDSHCEVTHVGPRDERTHLGLETNDSHGEATHVGLEMSSGHGERHTCGLDSHEATHGASVHHR